ncbi:hypothetical protein H8356DRAFT_1327052 [Neocallimastix lanati (nom. inval.)]|nr:hypothetical protein H8356DRAFT_1327052 [Neocallimastix sp. JGI-2020a]
MEIDSNSVFTNQRIIIHNTSIKAEMSLLDSLTEYSTLSFSSVPNFLCNETSKFFQFIYGSKLLPTLIVLIVSALTLIQLLDKDNHLEDDTFLQDQYGIKLLTTREIKIPPSGCVYFNNNYNMNVYNNKNDYNKNDYNKNDYNKNDYNKNDYNKNDYNKNDYNKNDYNKNDYNKNDYNKNDYNKNDYNKNNYNKETSRYVKIKLSNDKKKNKWSDS